MGVMSNYIPGSMGRNKKRSIIALWNVQDTEVVRTQDPSKRTVANPRLRPHGHWDR